MQELFEDLLYFNKEKQAKKRNPMPGGFLEWCGWETWTAAAIACHVWIVYNWHILLLQ